MGPHGRRLAEEVDQDEDRHAGEVLPLAGLLVPPHPVPAAHDVLPHAVPGKLRQPARVGHHEAGVEVEDGAGGIPAAALPVHKEGEHGEQRGEEADRGPGRDEGVDAVILGGGEDGGLAAEAALLHPGPERGPGAGQGQRRHARRARIELGALAAAILVAIIGEDLVIGAVQELGELRQRLGDNLTRPHRSATQEAGHQVGVAGRGVTLKYVPFNITTDFCK